MIKAFYAASGTRPRMMAARLDDAVFTAKKARTKGEARQENE